jgi:hypothetical protein
MRDACTDPVLTLLTGIGGAAGSGSKGTGGTPSDVTLTGREKELAEGGGT